MATSTLLLSNDAAGTADEERVAEVRRILAEGFDVTSVSTGTPQDLKRALSSFDGDQIVVAGGDGSLHVLINELARAGRLGDVVVGLVPLGTGNDFAGGVGISDDPLEAARACLHASPVDVDVIVADDGEHVVNAAHAGLGAVASNRAVAAKPVAGRLAYPLGAIQAGVTESAYDLQVTVDDELVHAGPALFVMVANGPRIGGGAHLCPGADPTDGMADVLVIDDVGRLERPGLGLDIQRGTHTDRDDVHVWRGRRVRISGQEVDHNRDGELLPGLADVTYSLHPSAWRLLR